jgi:hypothetical protein
MPRSAQYSCIGPWTVNNYTAADLEAARTAVQHGHCTYVVFCHEVGKNGTPHLQGFASTGGTKLTMSAWHKAIGDRFGLPRDFRGVKSIPDCIKYCQGYERKLDDEGQWDGKSYTKKEGSLEFEEFGTYQPGKRSDLLVLKRKVDEYEDPEDLVRDPQHFGTLSRTWKFFKQYQTIVTDFGQKRKLIDIINCRAMPKIFIRYGDNGVGKTRWVEDTFGKNAHYLMPVGKPDKRFYGFYDRHTTVLYNEFTLHKFSLAEFCNTFDHEGPLVETKGGYTRFKPLNVILTSNRNPAQWWDTTDPEWPAFMRRVHCCKHIFTLNGEVREECCPDFCKHGVQEEDVIDSEQESSEEVHPSNEEETSDAQVHERP